MYLNENEPVCEKNISEPKRTNIGNTLQRTALSPVLFNDIINPYKEQTWDINEECEKQHWNMNNKNIQIIYLK